MGISIMFFIALIVFMLGLVFKSTDSKTRTTIVTTVTILGILAFTLLLETNLHLIVEVLDAAFSFMTLAFVNTVEFVITSMHLAIVAFFEGFIWLFVVVAEAIGWVVVNSIWLFGQAPITCIIAFCMLCMWGASGE